MGAFRSPVPPNFDDVSTDELTEIAAAVRLFATISNFSVLSDIETTVNGFLLRLSYQEAIAEFIGRIVERDSRYGGTDKGIGPGDIGNYYPMEPGITWTYDATASSEQGSQSRHEKKVRTSSIENFFGCDTVFETTTSIHPGSHKRFLGKLDEADPSGPDFTGGADVVLECITTEPGRLYYDGSSLTSRLSWARSAFVETPMRTGQPITTHSLS